MRSYRRQDKQIEKRTIGRFFLIEIFNFGIFRIQLFIFYIGQIKLFIFIFAVLSILDWSKSEGLKYFFLHLRDQNIYFQNLPIPPSVQRGIIEYEGKLQYILRFPPKNQGERWVYTDLSGGEWVYSTIYWSFRWKN